MQRFEAEGRASFDRWSVSLLYGDYAAQPELGYLTRREGLLGSGSIKVASNWVVQGAARWDLEANQINQYGSARDMWTIASFSAATTSPPIPTPQERRRPCLTMLSCFRLACGRLARRRGAAARPACSRYPERHASERSPRRIEMTLIWLTETDMKRPRSSRAFCRLAIAAAVLLFAWPANSPLHAQSVAVMVNGEPITTFDIEQRSRLTSYRRTRLRAGSR